MKRTALAILLPALFAASAAHSAEIYNKNGNKLDLYGKMVGEHILTNTDSTNGDNNSQDTSYARFGIKGETQINSDLTGYGQFEYNMTANKPEGAQAQATRLAFAGLKLKDVGSFDYGRNYGAAYDAFAYTDMFVEWGGDGIAATDNFMTQRTAGVATYRNSDFFGMVDGLNFALQYQGKNNNGSVLKSNGDGYSMSVNYNIDGFGFVGAYGNSDRTDRQVSDKRGESAEVWGVAAKYDANSIYTAVMYGESRNMTNVGNGQIANKTQDIEAVIQYQFDFGLRPSLGYVYTKGIDLGNGQNVDADMKSYVELGAWYYFNKNFNVYTAYKFNLLDDKDAAITGASTDDQFAVGIVYQF